jgi:hypothetical protein
MFLAGKSYVNFGFSIAMFIVGGFLQENIFFCVFFLSGDFWVLFWGGEMGMIFSPSWEKQTEMTTFEPPIR